MSPNAIAAIVGILTGLFVVFLGLFFEHRTPWFANRLNRKELSYKVVSVTPLVSWAKDNEGNNRKFQEDKIEILYDGSSVHDVTSVVLEIENTGRASIVPKDFATPITVKFRGDQTPNRLILQAKVVRTSPAELDVNWTMGGGDDFSREQIEIHPILLNSGDSITYGFLLSGYEGVKLTARIAGVKKVIEKREPIFNLYRNTIFYGIVLILLILYNYIDRFFPEQNFVFIAFPVLMGLIGMIWGLYDHRFSSTRSKSQPRQ